MRHFLDCLMLAVFLLVLMAEVGVVAFFTLLFLGMAKRKGAG